MIGQKWRKEGEKRKRRKEIIWPDESMVMVMQDGDDGAGNVDDGEGRRSEERKDGQAEGTGEKMESAKNEKVRTQNLYYLTYYNNIKMPSFSPPHKKINI